MTFQLDTTGFIGLNLDGKVDPDPMNETAWTFADLDPFTQGYIEALFAGLHSHLTDQSQMADQHGDETPVGDLHGYCEDKVWSKRFAEQASALAFSDLAPETLARIIADCERFQNAMGEYGRTAWHGGNHFRARQNGSEGPAFPPLTVQLGDDGKVRFAA